MDENSDESGILEQRIEKLRNDIPKGEVTSDSELKTDNGHIQTVTNNSDTESGNHMILPGKSINILDTNVDLFRVNVKINGIILPAILDTGAVKSLISSEVVSREKFPIIMESDVFDALGSDMFHTSGKIKCSLSMGGTEMSPLELAVFPSCMNSRVDLLLGVDFLKSNSLIIDINNRLISRELGDRGVVRWKVGPSGDVSVLQAGNIPCYAANDMKLIPGEVYKVPVSSEVNLIDDLLAVYTDDQATSRISSQVRGYEGIVDRDSKFIFMLCTLPTTLKKGDKVGVINTVVELEQDDEFDEGVDGWEKFVKLDHLSNIDKTRVLDMLQKHEKVFSVNENDIGKASVTEHKILVNENAPIYQRPRRFPQPITDEIEKQCRELSEADIIEPSISPWSSPMVPVRKKDGKIRMCVDYRKLNAVTIPDKFPVPNLLDSIFGLSGTKFFTKLDLIRGYYQIPLEESSKQYTAFSTNRDHWQFKRLSFGLRNAPAAFQREIQAVLGSLPSNKVIAYIDDILILGSSFEEHVELVAKVLKTLETYGIKIKPSKCEWFRGDVEFLGHNVSSSGVQKTGEYVEKVRNYPRPGTVGELREFLGLINFQRKFIPHCSTLQKPLTRLTGGKSKKKLDWDKEMLDSFERLKTEMTTELELGYPDYSDTASKLELYVDASDLGGGAYLAQQQGDQHRVIGFASMTFTATQLGYSTIDRELAALRWGVKTFKPFLYGIEFILYTDHQPLIHLHNMKLVCSRLLRTVQELAEYNFEIRYIPGKMNSAADALSRLNNEVPCIPVDNGQLPPGLTFDGPSSPGGGDSLFISLWKVMTTLDLKGIPETFDELREQLVDDLLEHPTKYNIKLNRDSRKSLKLMKLPGKLPSLDIIMVACRLYGIKVYVYFWPESPVIYQYRQEDENVVHLQCLSGIYFNALVEVKSYKAPDVSQCSVNTV